MNELEQNVLDRAREWYYARQAAASGAAINWTDYNADYLEEAIGELVESEQELEPEIVLVFICF